MKNILSSKTPLSQSISPVLETSTRKCSYYYLHYFGLRYCMIMLLLFVSACTGSGPNNNSQAGALPPIPQPFPSGVENCPTRTNTPITENSPNTQPATLFMTEIYQTSDTKMTVEIYIADIPGPEEYVLLSQYGFRGFYRTFTNSHNSLLSINTTCTDFTSTDFTSDAFLYEGNFYSIIFTNQFGRSSAGQIQIILEDPEHPDRTRSLSMNDDCALFELYHKDTIETLDYIQMGDNCGPHIGIAYSDSTWTHTALTIPEMGGAESLSRTLTNDGSGFQLSPSGAFSETNWRITSKNLNLPPDAECVETNTSDLDKDGIYDCLEDQPSDRFFGMPLYDWGARTGQVDLFLEIDYMACEHSQDRRTQPEKTTIDSIIAKFLEYNVVLHVDTGSLFDSTPTTIDAELHNLGGGNNYLTSVDDRTNYFGIILFHGNRTLFDNIKKNHFSIIRKQVFHYMIMAATQSPTGTHTGLDGIAEYPGNDSLILLGGENINDPSRFYRCDHTISQDSLNMVINRQRSTLMHEFSHNLGLLHGGKDRVNYKPNYISIMNYTYGGSGVVDQTRKEVIEYTYYNYFQADYIRRGVLPPDCPIEDTQAYNNWRDNPSYYHWSTDDFRIGLSDGTLPDIDESNLDENLYFIFPNIKMDFNCDTDKVDQNIMADVNFDGIISVLKNFNDIAAIGSPYYKCPGSVPEAGIVCPFFPNDQTPSSLLLFNKDIHPRQTIFSDKQPTIPFHEELKFFTHSKTLTPNSLYHTHKHQKIEHKKLTVLTLVGRLLTQFSQQIKSLLLGA